MSPRYINALAEVDYIINELDIENKERIPEKFRVFINEHKSKEIKTIDIEKLQEETYAILAFIYRKFLATPEEREKLELEYKTKLKEEKERLNNIVNKEIYYTPKVLKYESKKQVILPVEYKEEVWYIKLFNKIKQIFTKTSK